ncbi:metallo-beta-lactamase domain protein [Bacteriovorax sp. BAL6_X]|uniref:MBL fold metallo-hydrolase n=1 Tax=Bacteriovorax sp. BAL6_X TaxID=1201290 RepID=UPI000385546D|nr:MBL fold metallo-hydrolase [Bacteriovorax sp. BAL6_X]EPZ50189.1 metallo-beta-lactamase domain protein [Bacteriovorax sp. BAL6_X]
MDNLNVETFFDEQTYTLTYIVYDKVTKDAVIIDPVLDYDQASSTITTESVKKIAIYVKERGLKPHYILESHAHADHLTGALKLKSFFPDVKVAINKNIKIVQEVFGTKFNILKEIKLEDFDTFLNEDELLVAGSIEVKAVFTPGHTPACTSFIIGNNVFTGDALFMPDYGTGRCDFPGGDANALYDSITKKLYTLPDETNVYTGHDYQPGGRELKYKSTIGENRKSNVHLSADTSREEYVKFRTSRDKTLAAPKLLLPSIQVNIRGGHMPAPQDNGVRYLQMPLTFKD